MNPVEILSMLTIANQIDPRVVNSPGRAEAWEEFFRDYPAPQVVEALYEHYRSEDRAVMPSHLLALTKKVRERAEQRALPSIDAIMALNQFDSYDDEHAARQVLLRQARNGETLDVTKRAEITA